MTEFWTQKNKERLNVLFFERFYEYEQRQRAKLFDEVNSIKLWHEFMRRYGHCHNSDEDLVGNVLVSWRIGDHTVFSYCYAIPKEFAQKALILGYLPEPC